MNHLGYWLKNYELLYEHIKLIIYSISDNQYYFWLLFFSKELDFFSKELDNSFVSLMENTPK